MCCRARPPRNKLDAAGGHRTAEKPAVFSVRVPLLLPFSPMLSACGPFFKGGVASLNNQGELMLAMDYRGPYHVRATQKSDPVIEHPNDAIVRVTRSCICGSDLHL